MSRFRAKMTAEKGVPTAVIFFVVEEMVEESVVERIVTSGIHVAAALIVLVEKTPATEGPEIIIIVVIVVVEEAAEETVSAAKVGSLVMRLVPLEMGFVGVVEFTEAAEQVVEVEGEAAFAEGRSTATAALLKRFVAQLVALTTLLRVGKNLVSRPYFLELLLCPRIFVFVRMIFDGEFSERLFDFFIGGRRFDA